MPTQSDKPKDYVRRARAILGLSQASFGLIIGCSQGVVSKYEKGTVNPSAETVMQCMHILQSRARGSIEPTGDPWEAVRQAMTELSIAIALAQQSR